MRLVSELLRRGAVNSIRVSTLPLRRRQFDPVNQLLCLLIPSRQNNPGSARVQGCVHQPTCDWMFKCRVGWHVTTGRGACVLCPRVQERRVAATDWVVTPRDRKMFRTQTLSPSSCIFLLSSDALQPRLAIE